MKYELILGLYVALLVCPALSAEDSEQRSGLNAFRAMREKLESAHSNMMANGRVIPDPFVVNGGKRLTNSRTISIESTNATRHPQIAVSLDLSMKDAQVFRNTGAAISYTLSEINGLHWLYLRHVDYGGQPLDETIVKAVELDTMRPVLEVESPTQGSTTDQGFINVKATVFDPDPRNPTKAGIARPIAVWINGERFWNRRGTSIDIPRFDVQGGANKLTIVATDEAGNRTERVIEWFVNLDEDKVPPTITEVNLHPDKSGKVILPDYPYIIVMGHIDDPFAIVTYSINAEESVRMNVIADRDADSQAHFAYRINLETGENRLVLSAIDGAGNARDYRYTIIRSKRYRFGIDHADVAALPNGAANMTPRVMHGYVSALRDPGTKNEARVVAVTLNGVPCALEAPDGDGNVRWQTTATVPLTWHGTPLRLDARIRWSDGEEY